MNPGGTGVYSITNKINGKRYIGSAARSFRERWNKHRHELRADKHHSSALQRAWAKYGEDAFVFEVLEECAPADAVAREQHYINLHDSFANGYNTSPTASSLLGIKHSEEARLNYRSAATRRVFSAETRAKFSANMKAKWADPEQRAKMAHANHAFRDPESYKRAGQKIKGRKHTLEALAKIAAASRALTPEKREEMRLRAIASGVYERQAAKLKGAKLSAQTRQRMSESRRGIPKSPEHRAKLAQRAREQHARQRLKRRADAWIDAHLGMPLHVIDWCHPDCAMCKESIAA